MRPGYNFPKFEIGPPVKKNAHALIRRTEIYTIDRNSAVTDEEVTNQANWRIRRVLLHQLNVSHVLTSEIWKGRDGPRKVLG